MQRLRVFPAIRRLSFNARRHSLIPFDLLCTLDVQELTTLRMRRWPPSVPRTHTRTSLFSSLRNVCQRPYTPAAVSQVNIISPSQTLQNTATPPRKPMSAPPLADPFKLVAPQIAQLRESLLNLVASSHPDLTGIAEYYFLHPSKQLRPLLVLLWSQAANGLGHDWRLKSWAAENGGLGARADELDRPLTRPDVLNDWNPNMPENTASFDSVFTLRSSRPTSIPPIPPPELLSPIEPRQVVSSLSILPTQMRLAQIVEMIHVASLLHDDVIDESPLRRGAPSAPAAFGNKMSILGGDFMLGRASAALSRLGSIEVVELISSVIANLVEGEILQMKAVNGRDESDRVRPTLGKENWNIYLQKTYLKSASLMAKGARAAVVLGGCREGEIWKEVAYAYGRNLGIAFQVSIYKHFVFALSEWSRTSDSLRMISWITNLLRARWASPVGLIYNSVSQRVRPCLRGRNIQSSARSSSASSSSLGMWNLFVQFFASHLGTLPAESFPGSRLRSALVWREAHARARTSLRRQGQGAFVVLARQ